MLSLPRVSTQSYKGTALLIQVLDLQIPTPELVLLVGGLSGHAAPFSLQCWGSSST